ncbi:MAG: 2-oxoglutarate synthase subunit KorC [Candidatus Heimdallarchaeota archaeon LC_3]|nr:MAG: 2-oxoglutarate synthase subunit KorC [Candidatus Heimdallarchaeota archaeon LC_3]
MAVSQTHSNPYKVTKKDIERRKRTEIIFSGMGGQGLVSAGSILARAMILFDNRNATQSQNYGPESRGGLSISEVIISEGEIDYPKVIARPKVLVTLSEESFNHFLPKMEGVGHLIADPEIIKIVDQYQEKFPEVKFHKIRITREAELLGNKIVGNIIVLGVLTSILNLNVEAIKKAIELQFSTKQKLIPMNIKALERGIELGKNL